MSDFPHEKAGLAHVRELLPDRSPFEAWSNFEFRDSQGKWHEVDLLVLGEGRIHLVELKHYRGVVGGNSYRWVRGRRSEDSPLMLARKKAQRLASVLKDAARELDPDLVRKVPYVQECVFLHAENFRSEIADPTDLFGLDGRQGQTGLPSIIDRLLEPRGLSGRPMVTDAEFLAIVDQSGFAVRRQREVGSWRLSGEPTAEGEGWQDWPAAHVLTSDAARIRFLITKPGASEAERNARRQLAQREYTLTRRLSHEGVLSPIDIVEDELGVGLVFPDDAESRRLDLWLADDGSSLSLRERLDLVRQLAEAVGYAHSNNVVHRGLNPHTIQVHRRKDGTPRLRISGWEVAGQANASSDFPSTGGLATRIFGALSQRGRARDDRSSDAFIAPEGLWVPNADRVRLDVFALGALSYLLLAGVAPAANGDQLKERIGRDNGLDLVADVPEVPSALRELVLESTCPRVSDRTRDVSAFLTLLSRAEAEAGSSENTDALEAAPGAVLGGRFELVRRLGSGSTAVGLLVADRHADGERRVLKVAIDASANRRLEAEAEVLRALSKRKYPRLIRLAEPEPLAIGDRTALVLESAGDETLADVLRDRSRKRLSLDLLERWGIDLLDALVSLDEAGIDHRDIKPSNLGVREQRSDRAKHLVLFDFSLSSASAASTTAGTPPYLDPFIGSGTRPRWDSAAERYAAAVTLFEMATGHTPSYGDGRSAPDLIDDEATVEAGDFDPAAADGLVRFFKTSLARDARQRHDTPAEMLAAWRDALTSATTTLADDGDAMAERASLTTTLAAAGLTARALSALEPFHLETVGDLAGLDPGRLSRMSGVAEPTRREVRSRAKQWRERFSTDLAARAKGSGDESRSALEDLEETAEQLVAAVGGTAAPARAKAARVLLGLDGDVPAFATLGEYAGSLHVGGQPQVSQVFAKLRDRWAEDEAARRRLDEIAERVIDTIAELDGVAWADTVVAALGGGDLDKRGRRIVAGLIRASLDRADDKAKGTDDEPDVIRRRRRVDNQVLLSTAPALAEMAMSLGDDTDELVKSSTKAGEIVIPAGRAAKRLRRWWPDGIAVPEDSRLVRLGARLSSTAAASNRGELYSRAMHLVDALRLTLSVYEGSTLSVADIRQRVRARFPGIANVPNRPALDRLLEAADLGLVWTGDRYEARSVHGNTTYRSSHVTAIPLEPGSRAEDSRHVAALRESVSAGSFLALGVPPRDLEDTESALAHRFGASVVNVTEILLGALRDLAERSGVPWSEVQAADAADRNSTPGMGLARLVEMSIPVVEEAISQAMEDAPERLAPVIVTEASPLARYGHMDVLTRLADITTPKRQAVWLLVPQEPNDPGALVDGVQVQLSYASQFLVLDRELLTQGESR